MNATATQLKEQKKITQILQNSNSPNTDKNVNKFKYIDKIYQNQFNID